MAPVSDLIWIGQYSFSLASVDQPHAVQEPALGPSGAVDFTMHDWSAGMQSVEQGIEYRTVEDTQSGYFDETRGYRRATLHSYITSKGVDAAFAGQVLIQPQATTVSVGSGPALGSILRQIDFVPSGGVITSFLIENQRYQHKITASANTWTQAIDGGSGYAAFDGIAQNSQISIGFGSAGSAYSSDGATWTTGSTNLAAHAFGVLGNNLYRAKRPNTVYAATAISGAWDSGSSISDSSYNINSLEGIEQILMIGKEDGVYSIDAEGLVVPFTPELRTQANSNFASVRASETFNSDYYFRTLNGVIEITAGAGQKIRVGLDQTSSPDLPTVVVIALTHDDRYLYALCANSSNDLMILRRGITGGWHTFYWDGSNGTKQGQHIAVSSVFGYPALFFSYYDGASVYTTKFIRLSTFPNALQDSNYRYDTSQTGRFRVGRYGSTEAQITFDQIMIQSRQCAAGVTITPYVAVDGGSITQFGSTSVTTNPSTTIKAATPITGNYFDLYFDLATNSATTTPVLMGFSLKGAYRPNHRKVHVFTFNNTRGSLSIRSGENAGSPVEDITNAETILATNTYQTVKDERGLTFQGLLMDLSYATIKPVKASDQPGDAMTMTVWEQS